MQSGGINRHKSSYGRLAPDSSLLESGASDWASLPERMHYIADLFRCYQQSGELFDAAFTAEQVVAMKSGQFPAGNL